MEWRLNFHDDAWGADLDDLTDAERVAVQDEVATWVASGPPHDSIKKYRLLNVLEHRVAECVVVYHTLESDEVSVVTVVRVRRSFPDLP